ncbi:MAG: MqnA/MqnD/SBP family protein [Pyrinomonadaceae bacterium]
MSSQELLPLLVTIIFREFLGLAPRLRVRVAADLDAMLEIHDAALLVGDPAGDFPARRFASLRRWLHCGGSTRAPGFVFAMWMARSQSAKIDSLRRIGGFAAARSEGLSQLEDIAAALRSSTGTRAATELRRYLEQNICFTMDKEMQTGLELFLPAGLQTRSYCSEPALSAG